MNNILLSEEKLFLFGYLRPFKPELKVREYESYKAVYCGLCREMGRSFGPLCRMTLSYDFTLLAMLHMAASKEEPGFESGRCCVNPLKKVPMCKRGESLEFSAGVAMVMMYYKLVDNVADSGTAKRILWSCLRPFAAATHNKAKILVPGADALVAHSMVCQRELEARKTTSVDEACEPTAAAMAGILRELSGDSGQRRVMERLGYFIGRYVYLCDALDDIERDVKSGNYNPFVLQARETGANADPSAIRDEAKASLYMTIAEIAAAYDLLESVLFGPILENIFTIGLRAVVDTIMQKKEKRSQ